MKNTIRKMVAIGASAMAICALALSGCAVTDMNESADREYDIYVNPFYDDYVSVFDESIPRGKVEVCFVGDSLTSRGLWNEFFPGLVVQNRGVMSDTSEGLLSRLGSIVRDDPDKVFLMIGTNDVGLGVPENETIGNVQDIISRLTDNCDDTRFYLQSIIPTCIADDSEALSIRSINSAYEDLARRYSNVDFVDLYPLFLKDDGTPDERLYGDDGVHLNGLGYNVWISAISSLVAN